jgi:hypothetical protein
MGHQKSCLERRSINNVLALVETAVDAADELERWSIARWLQTRAKKLVQTPFVSRVLRVVVKTI